MPRPAKHRPEFKVLVADDHEVFRVGLCQVLTQNWQGCEIVDVANFDDALEQLADSTIRLAILDLSMPGLADPAELSRIRRQRPDVRVVVVSGSSRREDVLACLDAGVHGYVVKSTATGTLIQHIERVMSGEIYVPPLVAILPAQRSDGASHVAPSQSSLLTERQASVLRLLVEGKSNKAIARDLGISEGTVKMHVAAVLRTIGATNRAHAAAIGRSFLA